MHRALGLALAIVVAHLLTCAATARADWLERTWTNLEGKTITARFIRATSTMATLNKEGKVTRVPLDQLVEADREWIEAAEELKKLRLWELTSGETHRARLKDIEGDQLILDERGDTLQLSFGDLSAEDRGLLAVVVSAGSKHGTISPVAAGVRTWTNNEGKTIEAEYRRVEGDQVVILFRGSERRVPLAELSDADRSYVENQQRGTALAQSEPTGGRSPAELTQEERIQEQLRLRRQRARRIAENDPPAPPQIDLPSPHVPRPQFDEPRFAEPRFPTARHETFEPPSWASDHPSRPGPRHRPSHEDELVDYGPTMVTQEVIECSGCGYQHPARTFKVGSKCRGCGRRIDYIQNADGSIRSSSPYYSGRKIGRLIGFAAFLLGLFGAMMKKVMG